MCCDLLVSELPTINMLQLLLRIQLSNLGIVLEYGIQLLPYLIQSIAWPASPKILPAVLTNEIFKKTRWINTNGVALAVDCRRAPRL